MNAHAAVALPVALKVTLGQASERGRKPVNQDFHGACVPAQPALGSKGIVLALADGIGSSEVSHEAAQAAVHSALEDYYCTSDAWSVKRSMQRVLTATNSWLHAQTQRGPHRHDLDRGYVCAMSALVIKGHSAHVFHAGDTRVYRLQGSTLEQLTEDHRVPMAGGQSYLSRALGFQAHLDLDYVSLAVECGDLFVLASDGVHEYVSAARIVDIARSHGDDLDGAARAIVAQALEAGSPDNLSVQLLRVDTLPDHQAGEAHRLRAGLPLPPLLRSREAFDGYRIERELHASHRSHIYLATDLDSGDSVVLKTPSIDLGQDEAYLDRFTMEEWIARRVNSAHVLRPRSRTRARSHLYVTMEYVQGQTLAQWMRDHPTPDLETVRDIVEQIARGLQAFHRMEMLHQDVRPENVMIDASGTVKIIDFGSTHVAGLADGAPSGQQGVLGTLSHSAPEYFLGESGSERSDQFSLGVLTYHMLTGRLPYGTRVAGIRTRADLKQLVYASAMDERRRIPAWVDGALMRAVHPQTHKRYEALSEFVHDLRHPNRAYLARTQVPLAGRHPVRFWKSVSLLLAVAVIVLLGLLQARGRTAATAASPSQPPHTTEKPST
jgi:serine/threonine protein phosphatase PrpC/predicted Ser/Thr protein kinase